MPPFTVDLMSESTHYLFSTLRLEGRAANGRRIGTGFFFGDRANWREIAGVAVITNRHVVEGCDMVTTVVHIADAGQNHRQFRVESPEPDKASETVGDQELVSNPSSDDGLLIHTAVGNAGGCGMPRRKRLGCMACAAASTRARSA